MSTTAITLPVPMLLFCPRCKVQHIDAPEPERGWDNPPHRSHLCSRCGCIFRPADIPTAGVEAIQTRGERDNWPEVPQPSPPFTIAMPPDLFEKGWRWGRDVPESTRRAWDRWPRNWKVRHPDAGVPGGWSRLRKPQVKSTTDRHTTTYHVTGNPDRVQAWIDDIMRNYDPRGYSTRVVTDSTDGGVRAVVVKRDNSCD